VRWRDGWVAYDCIEFDPALSWIDVISDFAFLYMDLASYGRWDLASACLATYLENTGDYAGLALLRFYSVYRALVRAKVDALAAEAGGESANAWRARMASRVDVASRLTARHRPTLMIMHGVTACGKSWVSEQLIPLLHAVRVRSDLERKRLQGVSPFVQRGAAVNAGPYAADATRETYAAMLGCAEHALRAGFNTIADATFLLKSDRERFRELARSLDCGFLVLACDADADALRRRVAARRQSGQEISEADEAVLSHQLATVEPLDDSERQCCIRLDTNWITSADTGIESVRDRVGRHAAPTT
jgi:predicted kinase